MKGPIPDPPRGRISADEYHRLFEAGALGDGRRIELLAGEIHEAAAIGGRHAGCVRRLAEILHTGLAGRAVVSVQNPVALSDTSEPEPDLALLAWRDDRYSEHPKPEDVLLLIEVSETSYRVDRKVKLPLYAKAGIPEAWIVDLTAGRVETWRDPRKGRYRDHKRLGQGDLVSPSRFPEVEIPIARILGPV